MRKILGLVMVLCLGSFILIGCGDKKSEETVKDAEAYAVALKDAGLAVDELIVYTEETDENELLGRPSQYTSKVNFTNGSVEVFNNNKDAVSRQEYINSIGESSPLFAEYNYIKGNALLRINKSLTPEEAKKYETEFMKL